MMLFSLSLVSIGVVAGAKQFARHTKKEKYNAAF